MQEPQVPSGFWQKVKRTMGKVPFIPDVVALYFCAIDPATPIAAKATAVVALAYFISPLDAVPDIVPVAGYGDDALAIFTAIKVLGPYVTDEHRRKARSWLNGAVA